MLAATAPDVPSPPSTMVSLFAAEALTSQTKRGACVVVVAFKEVVFTSRRDRVPRSNDSNSVANDDASFVAVGLPGPKSKSTTSLPVLPLYAFVTYKGKTESAPYDAGSSAAAVLEHKASYTVVAPVYTWTRLTSTLSRVATSVVISVSATEPSAVATAS